MKMMTDREKQLLRMMQMTYRIDTAIIKASKTLDPGESKVRFSCDEWLIGNAKG